MLILFFLSLGIFTNSNNVEQNIRENCPFIDMQEKEEDIQQQDQIDHIFQQKNENAVGKLESDENEIKILEDE